MEYPGAVAKACIELVHFATIEEICRVVEYKPGDILAYVTDIEYKRLMRL